MNVTKAGRPLFLQGLLQTYFLGFPNGSCPFRLLRLFIEPLLLNLSLPFVEMELVGIEIEKKLLNMG